ncbi:hypothetical protein [Candidatus Magnetominusculus xianensis]|uniref:Secreted protein n=1 Tax=Candidatus Magnetominusculus xianensis TaxID=1748249 RepID=A0ABR5SBE9_9BACT|nr:hypothetical protein [Candidatus Magnetominusculus xianensis]KWT77355.1 hypothetical protein ASN18_3050 [Candidatus Magnetominusculus xianensis]MBF0404962.1 hypothetical protein [Nitrospirota bacterium]
MKKFMMVVCLGLMSIAALGCMPGTVKTTVQITDNCTLGVSYDNGDNGTARLDVICGNE